MSANNASLISIADAARRPGGSEKPHAARCEQVRQRAPHRSGNNRDPTRKITCRGRPHSARCGARPGPGLGRQEGIDYGRSECCSAVKQRVGNARGVVRGGALPGAAWRRGGARWQWRGRRGGPSGSAGGMWRGGAGHHRLTARGGSIKQEPAARGSIMHSLEWPFKVLVCTHNVRTITRLLLGEPPRHDTVASKNFFKKRREMA